MVDLIDGEEVIVTGEELKSRLTAMGFTVPVVEPYVREPLVSIDFNNDGHISNEEMAMGDLINRPIREENARRLQAFFDQFTDFAEVLEATGLRFARYAKMRKSLPNGSPDFRWILGSEGVPIKYGYLPAAERVMGKYTKGKLWAYRDGDWVVITPIQFIAFERFG